MVKKNTKNMKAEEKAPENEATTSKKEATKQNNAAEKKVQEEKTTAKKKEKDKKKKTERKDKKDLTAEKINELEHKLGEKNDQLLRLHAEFDNYRKRTLKEKMELTKAAGEGVLINILPVVDDFERALQSITAASEVEGLKEGVELIYKRFNEFLKNSGVKEIEAKEKEFDTDLHEAVTKIPAPSEELKGKIVDVIQKGYTLNDKVIRFAKVVIGE
ncbi:MAG: nucleotide exchange factor GrpE [Prolixibacteraceae bacterium]|nr:nucleotide exchange factor GrpE [Prolixibacteraceae bacterium]